MLDSYLNILQESLEKKLEALKHIEEINHVQSETLRQEELDMETFDRTVDEKDIYVEELNKLDEGFETLYDRVKEELSADRSKYAVQIRHLQKLISEITDKSVSIQAEESRNKALLENYFARQRKDLGKVRKSSKAAYGYYQNMNNKKTDSFFLDKKK